MKTLRRFAWLLSLYLFALIPVHSVFAVLEGGIRGLWHLSANDWIYQGSAALGQAGFLFIVGGLVAVPVITAATRMLATAPRGAEMCAVLAFVVLFVCVGLLAKRMLLVLPVAYFLATALYSLLVFHIVRNERSSRVLPNTR